MLVEEGALQELDASAAMVGKCWDTEKKNEGSGLPNKPRENMGEDVVRGVKCQENKKISSEPGIV